MSVNRSIFCLTLAVLTLVGCHSAPAKKSIEALDKELTSANAADPAVKGALEDQIMVDPQLAAKANIHNIRPPDEPFSGPLPPSERHTIGEGTVPPTLGQRAMAAGAAGCDLRVAYSALWATKLPADVPIYPQGHVSEAAGSDTPTCHLRVVSYASSASPQSVADFYTTHARDAGYFVTQAGDTLIGTRKKDGAMFQIIAAATPSGGSSVDVVSNAGR